MAVNVKDMNDAFGALIKFREMTTEDLSDVIHIENQAYTHPWTLGIFRDCLRVGYRCWVAENEEKVIGYGIVMLAGTEAHILNLCINPDQQGAGNGRALLTFLLEQIKASGVDMVLLEVRESNQHAITLYQSIGFHELGVRRDYYPADEGREDAILFAKTLDPEII